METDRPSHESKPESSNAIADDSSSDRAVRKAAYRRPRGGERHGLRNRKTIIAVVLLCIVILGLALGLGLGLGLKKSSSSTGKQGQTSKPNVLVIMSDDQDLKLDSMSVMPNVNKLFGDEGVRYERHYCTVAWCCPSRVNFLTGRAAHNTNVTSVVKPYGGWYKFAKEGLNDNYLPVWINQTGIGTYYVGKFLNGYGIKDFESPAHPNAWTDMSMLIDPWTYNYYHSHWTNGYTDKITPFPGIHTTDVTQSKALAMLDKAAGSGDQFFMMVTPVAPHQELAHGSKAPPIPDQWKGVFNNRTAPRTENFNPAERSGSSWVYNSPRLDDGQVQLCDTTYYHRLANIAAIDQMVANLVDRLDYHGIKDNTYVIYTSDNGFHIGNHRLLPGKRCPYEEDVNIPFLIRGPDVPQGINSTITNSHTDVAPTILKMLGLPNRDEFDGAAMAYTKDELYSSTKQEIVNVEFWDGDAGAPIGVSAHSYYNNTYKALRMYTNDYNLYYSTWCTGEREFFDMNADEQQMNNLLGSNPKTNSSMLYYGRSTSELIDRLDAILIITKSCKQDACRNPWGVLFPKGQVSSLQDAMDTQYDSFFAQQPKVQFDKCTSGYIASKELPTHANLFGGGQVLLGPASKG